MSLRSPRDPLVTIAPAGRITGVNRATETVTGYPRDWLIGKYGGSVAINIEISRVSESDGGGFYKVIVEDNGPGIPDVQKDKIFNRFLRGDTKARGSGIGLYLVKALLDYYSGKVWVEDRIKGNRNAGSRFVVELPAVDSP